MLTFENIVTQEINHRHYINQTHKELTELYNSSYSLFLDAVNESQQRIRENKDKDFNNVFLMMCMKINADVRVIYAGLEAGWYGTAICLIREINDAFNKLALISYHPEYAKKISIGKMRNKDVKAALKKHNIDSAMPDKIWGSISEVKHAEANGIIAYGNFSHSPIKGRFLPSINDYLFEGLLAETCYWMVMVAEKIKYYILSKYDGEFIKSEFPSEVLRLADLINQRLRILKTKSL